MERLRSIERSAGAWGEAAAIGIPRPTLEGKHTTEDDAWNKKISDALAHHAKKSEPTAVAKKVASSDRLVKEPDLVKAWQSVLKGVAAVEMEIAGVYVFCQRNNVPVLTIRGISDIIGWKRNEAWTLYACHTAAAYVRMLICAGAFNPATEGTGQIASRSQQELSETVSESTVQWLGVDDDGGEHREGEERQDPFLAV